MTEVRRKLIFTYIAMLLAMLFWGYSFIWTKKLLDFYNPFTIILLRLVISSVFLLFIGKIWKRLKPIAFSDLKLFVLLAFFEPFLYFIGESYGLKYVSATISSVLIATIPLFSLVAAWLFLKEKLSLINILGIVISILGVFLVILNKEFEINVSIEGLFLLALAVLSAIGYSLVVIKVAKQYSVFTIIFYQNVLGIFFFVPLFLIFDYESFLTVEINLQILKPLFALAILASSLAFMLFTYGIRELGLVKANTISNIIPVFTAFFSYFVLGEVLNYINIFGIIVVLSGLFLSQLKKGMILKNIIIPLIKLNGRKK